MTALETPVHGAALALRPVGLPNCNDLGTGRHLSVVQQ